MKLILPSNSIVPEARLHSSTSMPFHHQSSHTKLYILKELTRPDITKPLLIMQPWSMPTPLGK